MKGNRSAKPGLDSCNNFVKLGLAVNKTITFLGTEEQLQPLKIYTSNRLREMGLGFKEQISIQNGGAKSLTIEDRAFQLTFFECTTWSPTFTSKYPVMVGVLSPVCMYIRPCVRACVWEKVIGICNSYEQVTTQLSAKFDGKSTKYMPPSYWPCVSLHTSTNY